MKNFFKVFSQRTQVQIGSEARVQMEAFLDQFLNLQIRGKNEGHIRRQHLCPLKSP
jgi:hypothetical protein